MSDEETGTLWSHILGKAMQGELEGATLKSLPSVVTSWADWKEAHPDSVVLTMPKRLREMNYDTSFYQSKAKESFVIGYVNGNSSRHYSFDVLYDHPLINDTVNKQPILVSFNTETAAAMAFERTVDEQVLTFKSVDSQTRDSETDSVWDLRSGIATDGKMKGKKLRPVVVIPSYKEAWAKFHPQSTAYSPE